MTALITQGTKVEILLLDGLESGQTYGQIAADLEARTHVPLSTRTLRRWRRILTDGGQP